MYYSHPLYMKDIEELVHQIAGSGKEYDYIVGVVRGGAIPAVCLSHRLNLPMRTVSWSTFHKDQMRECAMDIADDIADGKRILIVDDILDSGRTLKELLEDWGCDRSKLGIAVLIYNKAQELEPDYYGTVIDRTEFPDWINFWWEKDAHE